jgi:peptidoglycan/LPS O-acetylase OafA/YrhL
LTMIVFIIFIVPDIFLSAPNQLIKNIVSHLLFIHNIFPSTHGSINGVNWSLATEMQFYLLIFLLGGMIKKLVIKL